jgi:hypothetical protein
MPLPIRNVSLFALGLLAAACGSAVAPGPTQRSVPTGTASLSTSTPVVGATRLLAELSGQLELTGGCLRVRSRLTPGDDLLLIFAPDFTATIYGDRVEITDLSEQQHVTWRLGDTVYAYGGYFDSPRASLPPPPAGCAGPYFLFNGWFDPATPTPTMTLTATPLPLTANAVGFVRAAETVGLRAGPSTVFDTVGQLTAGQSLPVVGQSGQWWALALSDGHTGWVFKDIVNFTGDAPAVPVLAPLPTPTPAGS